MSRPYFSLMGFSHTLVGKMTKIYLIVALSIVSLTGFASLGYMYRHAYLNAEENLSTRAATLADGLESAVNFGDIGYAQRILDDLKSYPEIVAAWVIKDDGEIFVGYGERMEKRQIEELAGHTRMSWHRIGIVEPIGRDSPTSAHLVMVLSIEKLNHDSMTMIASGAVLALLVMLAGYLLFMHLTPAVSRPIDALVEVIREIEKTRDYNMRAPILSQDEIGELAHSFNAMIASLEHQNSKLDRELMERTLMQERLDRLAHYDAVTHLPNRHFFHDRIQIALEQSEIFERSMAIIFVDLDNFKLINDSYGHQVGDLLLRSVAERLTGALRSGDIVSRIGGDEFAIIIESLSDVTQLSSIAEKLIHNLALPLNIEGNNIVVSGSMGGAVFPEDADSVDSLQRFADMAMYAAKAAGKNTWRRYDPSMSGHSEKRLSMESKLRIAMQDGHLALYYQPQIDITSGRIVGFEALARWLDPESGFISPAEFIPVAEDSGLINPLGEWVLHTACLQAMAWYKAEIGSFRVAVNVSVRQLSQLSFATLVVDTLESIQCPPELIELEITESALMQYGGRCRTFLELFDSMKLNIAIDDFGTGYSSMSHLKHLPVGKLKIDKSFVDDIVRDPAALVIAQAITGLAKNLGIGLIAEGVETKEQLDLLSKIGCYTVQGYYFGRPMPAADVPAFWTNFKPAI